MINTTSWNNKRHCTSYWIAILMLLFVALNITGWRSLEEIPVIGKLRDLSYDFYSFVIPPFVSRGVEYILLTLITLYFIGLLLIWLINHLCGILPNIKLSENVGVCSYLLKTVVIADILLGIVLEVFAMKGLWEFGHTFRITSIASWMYIALFAYGSCLYWKSTILLRKMHFSNEVLKVAIEHEKKSWYCVCNCKERISTFSRAPWKGSIRELIIDEIDIKNKKNVSMESFLNYLIVIDCNMELNEISETSIRKTVMLPHANVLAFIFGESENYKHIRDYLNEQKNVKVVKYSANNHCERLDIETLIVNTKFKNETVKEHPFRFLKNRNLKELYLDIGKGPKVCLDFMKTIMNELDILPSIYALFDYIDLQYRIAIACTLESDFKLQYNWMRQKWRVVGNISVMANIVEDTVIKRQMESYTTPLLNNATIFAEIITEHDFTIINKYLPNYEKDITRPVEDTVVYLTSSLRNVLRGHGTFDKKDAKNLYILVFKLVLLNVYLLGTNEVALIIEDDIIWDTEPYRYRSVIGNRKNNHVKKMSPFLVASANDNILVFNNWSRGYENECEQVEYINYLDGTLILPEYKSVDVKKGEAN